MKHEARLTRRMRRLRDEYAVPAHKGAVVYFLNEPYTVIGTTLFTGLRLRIRHRDEPRRIEIVHPSLSLTWPTISGRALEHSLD